MPQDADDRVWQRLQRLPTPPGHTVPRFPIHARQCNVTNGEAGQCFITHGDSRQFKVTQSDAQQCSVIHGDARQCNVTHGIARLYCVMLCYPPESYV